jgi:hypothetical protein
MADVIVLANTVTVSASSTKPEWQPLFDAPMDVSAYDLLDLQLYVLSCNFGGNAKVRIMTTMAYNKNESTTSDPSWGAPATNDVGVSTLIAAGQSWQSFTAPTPNQMKVLLRYVRWAVDFAAATPTTLTFSLTGMARRRVA